MNEIIIWHNGTPAAVPAHVAAQFGIERTTNVTDAELYQRIIDALGAATGATCSNDEGCAVCSA